jgi:hypothetical protein
MANASHQSKQKQQTSKKGSQASASKQSDSNERVNLSVQQALMIKELLQARNEAESQVQFFLLAAGLSEKEIISGNLDGDNPHFIVKGANGITR